MFLDPAMRGYVLFPEQQTLEEEQGFGGRSAGNSQAQFFVNVRLGSDNCADTGN